MYPDFLSYAEHVKPSLDAAFGVELERLLRGSGALDLSGSAPLRSGKKMRGTLLCLVNETLGGDLREALPRAVAVELIQTASLIHDDFVDQHPRRRNHPALWTLEGARRAVLLGDVIFASAIRMMSETGRRDCRIVSDAIAEVSLGAFQEPLTPSVLLCQMARGGEGSFYQKLIHLKTAVLFGAACELGAVAARAGEREQQLWRNYGLKIGEAYQIADDLQDVERLRRQERATAEELAPLVPVLIHFGAELEPHLMRGVRGGSLELADEVAAVLRDVAQKARGGIVERLETAVAWVAGDLSGHLLSPLALQAPGDLIRIFDASAREPSGQ